MSSKKTRRVGAGLKNKLTAKQRRNLIIQELNKEGQSELYYKELDSLNGKAVSRASIKLDVDTLNDKEGYDKYLRSQDMVGGKIVKAKASQFTFTNRLEVNKSDKIAIAQFLSYLIIDSSQTLKSAFEKLKEVGEKKGNQSKFQSDVIFRLQRLWNKSERSILIEAGTTTYYLGEELIDKQPPVSNCVLCDFVVATNSLAIMNQLSKPNVRFIANQIGGKLNRERLAFRGSKTIASLKSMATSKYNMAVVGTVLVDTERMRVYTDDSKDAGIKSAMLQASELRVVVADSSKFNSPNIGNYEGFAEISTREMDVIITNKLSGSEEELVRYKETVKKIRATGVVVFEADQYLSLLD